MPENKKDTGFTVSDRRPFTSDGELRTETPEIAAAQDEPSRVILADNTERVAPPPPTSSEQQAQHEAYKQSSRDLDAKIEQGGHSPRDLEISFERFLASLYMTAMMQLGLMVEQGGSPHIDLIGARQTVDTLGMLADKTKGNLSQKEQGFLQNALYELRMAYVEVTNALARSPQAPGPGTGTNG